MLRLVVAVLIVAGVSFALTLLLPADDANPIWPFAKDSRPLVRALGPDRLPPAGGMTLALVLAGVAVVAFVLALLSLFGIVVASGWWVPLVFAGSGASVLLFLLYLSPFALLPLAVDVILAAGIIVARWTPDSLSS